MEIQCGIYTRKSEAKIMENCAIYIYIYIYIYKVKHILKTKKMRLDSLVILRIE